MTLLVEPYGRVKLDAFEDRESAWSALLRKTEELFDLNEAYFDWASRIEELNQKAEQLRLEPNSAPGEEGTLTDVVTEIDILQQEHGELEDINHYLDELRSALRVREFLRSKRAWEKLSNITTDYGGREYLSKELEDDIDLLFLLVDDISPPLIFSAGRDLEIVRVPALIIEINQRWIHEIACDPSLLQVLSPRAFEEFIAEIFSSFGYRVELTAQTRDGGRDIVAVRSENSIASKLLIECKRFSPHRKVGVSLVRELYAVKTMERATKAVMATTATFSPDARAIEARHLYELELKDFDAVAEWARGYSEWLRGIKDA